MQNKVKLLLALAVLLLGLAVGCTRAGTKEEEIAAAAFLDAVLHNDDEALSGLICGRTPDGSASQDLLSLWAIGFAVKAAGQEFDPEGLKVDVIARRTGGVETEAEVLMRGNVEFPTELEPSDQMPLPAENVLPIDETWRMVNEEGAWKWCGGVSQE